MQNRENQGKKAMIEVDVSREVDKISFSEGGGINVVFRPKYRPLRKFSLSSIVFQV
jgi:hypothetical protein